MPLEITLCRLFKERRGVSRSIPPRSHQSRRTPCGKREIIHFHSSQL